MDRISEMKQRPTYKFPCTIKSGGREINDVICEITLPDKSPDAVSVVCYPDRLQQRALRHVFELSLRGNVLFPDGSPQTTIEVEKAYSMGLSATHWALVRFCPALPE